jgi:hypothetical protein
MEGRSSITSIFCGTSVIMNFVVKEQKAWAAGNTLDASIAVSAAAALGSLIVADGDLAATAALSLAGGALVTGILLRNKKQKEDRAKPKSSPY